MKAHWANAENVLFLNFLRIPQVRIPVAVDDPGAMVTIEPLCPAALHGHAIFGTSIDARRHGRPYQFLYAGCIVGTSRPCNSYTGVIRVDVTDGTAVTFEDLPNLPIGMPVFVPRPGAAEDDETDGVVLLDYIGADGLALIIVMDGRSFQEVARVTVPHRHCMSPHDTWVWE